MNEVVAVGLLVGAGAVLVLVVRLAAIERRLARLSRMETKVDLLLRSAGVAFDAMHDVPPGVREALDRGETILAIKRFREATGAGLKDAKDFVDEVRRRQAPVA